MLHKIASRPSASSVNSRLFRSRLQLHARSARVTVSKCPVRTDSPLRKLSRRLFDNDGIDEHRAVSLRFGQPITIDALVYADLSGQASRYRVLRTWFQNISATNVECASSIFSTGLANRVQTLVRVLEDVSKAIIFRFIKLMCDFHTDLVSGRPQSPRHDSKYSMLK